MKHLFLISSAVNAKHGIYTPRERFVQTLETCVSIKKYCPNSEMILLDGGIREISDGHKEYFFQNGVKNIVSFVDDSGIKEIQKSTNHDIVKNVIEVLMYKTFFDNIDHYNPTFDYDRVFKISGRYKLNKDFDISQHESAEGKIVIRGPFESQFPDYVTGGVTKQYMSRLWSFDASLLPYVRDVYGAILAKMNERKEQKGYIDIEHCLYDLLSKQYVVEVQKIGVEGHIAPNGMGVSE